LARIKAVTYYRRQRKKRPGIHSKNTSRLKSSKGYKKKYKSQGRV